MAKPIESVVRAFDGVHALTRFPLGATLAQLASALPVPIPKPTLLSLLYTLRDLGVVQKADDRWELAAAWLLRIEAYVRVHLERAEAQQWSRRLSRRNSYECQTTQSGPDAGQ